MFKFSTANSNFKALPAPHKAQKFIASISEPGYFKNHKLGKKGRLRFMIESFHKNGHTNKSSQRDAKTAARFCHPCWLRCV